MFIGNNAIKWHFVFCHCFSVSLNKFCIQPSFLMILCTLHYIVRLMEKTILNFNFDYLHPSLIITLFSENSTTFSTGFNHCNFSFPSRSRSFPRMEASDSLPEFREWIFFIPFPFPNFGNGFFSFPSRSRISGMDFFHSLPVPKFREWVFSIPFPFPNPQKSFPLTPAPVQLPNIQWQVTGIEAACKEFMERAGYKPHKIDSR